MAATHRNTSHPSSPAFERTRAKIQTTQLVKRLQEHTLGNVELSTTQVRAAQILIDKSLPSLQAMEMLAEVNVNARFERMSEDELDKEIEARQGKKVKE